jgi:hypothetical protein
MTTIWEDRVIKTQTKDTESYLEARLVLEPKIITSTLATTPSLSAPVHVASLQYQKTWQLHAWVFSFCNVKIERKEKNVSLFSNQTSHHIS